MKVFIQERKFYYDYGNYVRSKYFFCFAHNNRIVFIEASHAWPVIKRLIALYLKYLFKLRKNEKLKKN